jgi:hypothetical protein
MLFYNRHDWMAFIKVAIILPPVSKIFLTLQGHLADSIGSKTREMSGSIPVQNVYVERFVQGGSNMTGTICV